MVLYAIVVIDGGVERAGSLKCMCYQNNLYF